MATMKPKKMPKIAPKKMPKLDEPMQKNVTGMGKKGFKGRSC